MKNNGFVNTSLLKLYMSVQSLNVEDNQMTKINNNDLSSNDFSYFVLIQKNINRRNLKRFASTHIIIFYKHKFPKYLD